MKYLWDFCVLYGAGALLQGLVTIGEDGHIKILSLILSYHQCYLVTLQIQEVFFFFSYRRGRKSVGIGNCFLNLQLKKNLLVRVSFLWSERAGAALWPWCTGFSMQLPLAVERRLQQLWHRACLPRGTWDLPRPRIKPCIGRQILNHQTTRKVQKGDLD